MISYAGIPLCTIDAALAEHIAAHVPLDQCIPFEGRAFPGERRERWAFHGWRGLTRIEVGKLLWPNGADRFSVGWFLADSAMLAAIGPTGRNAPLVLSDGVGGGTVTANLWFLAALPLAFCLPPADRLWLLTLVDDRYFWREQAVAIPVVGGTTSWANLYSSIGAALGTAVAADAVAGAYLTPDPDLSNYYDSLTQQLDTVAYNVGQRVIRRLDGTVAALNAAHATTLQAANIALAAAANRPLLAGGDCVPPALPSSINVAFRRANYFAAETAYVRTSLRYAVNVVGGGPSAVAGAHLFHDNAVARFTYATDASTPTVSDNAAELTALATQIAADWYAWQAAGAERVYGGIVPWVPGGFADAVEWTHRAGEMTTRIRRPPWNDLTEELLHYGTYPWPARLTVNTASGSASVPEPVRFVVDTSTGLTLTVDTIAGTASLGFVGGAGNSTFTTLYITNTLNLSANDTILLNGVLYVNAVNNGYWVFNAPVEICGFQFWCCVNYTLPSGSNNDLNLPAVAAKTIYNLSTPGTNSTITGIVPAKPDGANAGPQIIALRNVDAGGKTITLTNNDAASSAANRMLLSPTYGTSVTLAVNDVLLLWYDTCTSTKWAVISCTVDTDSSSLTSGESTNSSSFAIGSGYASYAAVILPSAGTYIVWGFGCYYFPAGDGSSVGDVILAQLYDATTATAINYMDAVYVLEQATPGVSAQATACATLQARFTVSGADTIQLRAQATSSGSPHITKPSLIYLKVG
jgi:hypothetical protein